MNGQLDVTLKSLSCKKSEGIFFFFFFFFPLYKIYSKTGVVQLKAMPVQYSSSSLETSEGSVV